jgi:hypothetical protein
VKKIHKDPLTSKRSATVHARRPTPVRTVETCKGLRYPKLHFLFTSSSPLLLILPFLYFLCKKKIHKNPLTSKRSATVHTRRPTPVRTVETCKGLRYPKFSLCYRVQVCYPISQPPFPLFPALLSFFYPFLPPFSSFLEQ